MASWFYFSSSSHCSQGDVRGSFREAVAHLDSPMLLGMGYPHMRKVFVIVHLVVLLNLSTEFL